MEIRTGVLKRKKDEIMRQRTRESIMPCLEQLIPIFYENYSKDEEFKKELLAILFYETGSNNLGELCEVIIDAF